MLDGLDNVNWSELEHAYGEASNVPDMIRGLLSDDPEMREIAQGNLEITIFHQGTWASATPYAIPFLMEILLDTQSPEREWLARFISSMMPYQCSEIDWSTFPEVIARHMQDEANQDVEDEYTARMNQQMQEMYTNHTPDFIHLLKDNSLEVRLNMIVLLTKFSCYQDKLYPVLHDLVVTVKNEKERCILAHYSGLFKDSKISELAKVILVDDSEPDIVRLGAGFGLIKRMNHIVSTDELKQFIQLATYDNIEKFNSLYSRYVIMTIVLAYSKWHGIKFLPVAQRRLFVPLFEELIREAKSRNASNIEQIYVRNFEELDLGQEE